MELISHPALGHLHPTGPHVHPESPERIRRLHDLREWTESGTMELLPVRERIAAMARPSRS